MNRKIFIFFFIFLAAVLEVSFFSNLFSNSAVPDLSLVIIAIWSTKKGFERTLFLVIFLGLILDLLFLGPIGTHIMLLLFVAFVSSSLAKRLAEQEKGTSIIVLSGIVAVTTIVNFIGLKFISEIYSYFLNLDNAFFADVFRFRVLGIKIFYNIIMLWTLFWPISKIGNIFYTHKDRVVLQ